MMGDLETAARELWLSLDRLLKVWATCPSWSEEAEAVEQAQRIRDEARWLAS